MFFRERKSLRIAIHSSRRTEHKFSRAALTHRLQQSQRSDDIIVVIGHGLLNRLPYRFEAGKMNH